MTSTTESRKLVPVPKMPGVYMRGGSFVVRYRDSNGKQRQESVPTKREAQLLKAARKIDVHRGEFAQLSRTTFADYALDWLGSYKGRTARGIRSETIDAYGRELGFKRDDEGAWAQIEPPCGAVEFFGRSLLTEIDPGRIRAYATHVESRGVRPNTVRLAMAPVKLLLATAVEDGKIRWNPSAGLRLTNNTEVLDEDGAEVEKAKALSADELTALLATVADEFQLLVHFLAHTGLRVSEALGLQWWDITFGKPSSFKVRRRLSRGALKPPKSTFGKRTLKLSPAMSKALWDAQKKRPNADPKALVFQRLDGRELDRHVVFRVVKSAAKVAGVPWAGVHTLRHTCASTLFRSGWNPAQIQRYLGHHSAAFTLSTYVHLLPEDMPASDFLDDVIPLTNAPAEGTENGKVDLLLTKTAAPLAVAQSR